jgi:hypothetical protein
VEVIATRLGEVKVHSKRREQAQDQMEKIISKFNWRFRSNYPSHLRTYVHIRSIFMGFPAESPRSELLPAGGSQSHTLAPPLFFLDTARA